MVTNLCIVPAGTHQLNGEADTQAGRAGMEEHILLCREGGPLEDLMEADLTPESTRDSLTSLIALLGVVYKAFPDLYLDPVLRQTPLTLALTVPLSTLIRNNFKYSGNIWTG